MYTYIVTIITQRDRLITVYIGGSFSAKISTLFINEVSKVKIGFSSPVLPLPDSSWLWCEDR